MAIVYSNDGSEKLFEFARRASSKRGAVYLNVEKVEDIFNTIRTLSRGLKINADALPCIDPVYENDDAPEDDPFINISKDLFEDKIFGKHAILIVGKRWFVRPFTALAKQLGLGVCSAITITKAPVFSIKSGKSTLSEMRAGIFDAIDSCTRIKTRTSDEKTSDLLLPKVEKKNCDSSRDESVYFASSPLSSDSFRSALTAVSAPIIYAAMDGYSTRNSALSIAVSLVGDMGTPDSSSQLFSAVLGVYRAVTELGLPSDAFSVSLEKGQPRITAALHSAPFSKKANISSSLTVDEMLSLLFPVGDEPKFEVIRDLSNGENITFENIVI